MKLDADTWIQVAGFFDQLSELDPSERTARKRDLQIPDKISYWLDLMLEAHDASDSILLDRSLGNVLSRITDIDFVLPDELRGDLLTLQFGPWRAVEEIGRGGMGIVLKGERADGQFEKTVAIKLLTSERFGTPQSSYRIQEIMLLAGLEHPHIAHLLDSGETANGIPYLVMEYIEGLPITRYSQLHALSIRERVRLLVQAIEAVAYSHRWLVVHCDIKPANVLVMNEGQVKLVDFGISSRLEGKNDAPIRHSILRCSPAYAAPEQLAGASPSIAQDIFALGAILFELLTDKGIRNAGQATRILFDRIPDGAIPKPSDVVSEVSIDRDLDAICLKALAIDPEHRYQSAEELASDLNNWLTRRPVNARQGGRIYRLGKWMQRERWVALATGAAFLALINGASVAIWQAHEAGVAAERAIHEREVSIVVIDFLVHDLLSEANPMLGADPQLPLRQAVSNAAERVETALAGQPRVAAAVHGVLGQVFRGLSDPRMAVHHHQKQLELLTRLSGPESLQAATVHEELCHTMVWHGRPQEGREHCDSAKRIRARFGSTAPKADVFHALADFYQGRFTRGLTSLQENEELIRASADEDLLWHFLFTKGLLTGNMWQFAEAKVVYAELLEIARSDRSSGDLHIARAQEDFGPILLRLGDVEAGEAMLRDAMTAIDSSTQYGHPMRLSVRIKLADGLLESGQLAAARTLLEQGLTEHLEVQQRMGVLALEAKLYLARVAARDGEPEHARALIDEVSDLVEAYNPALPAVAVALQWRLARVYADVGMSDAAELALGRLDEFFASGIDQPPGAALSMRLMQAQLAVQRDQAETAAELLQSCRRDAEALLPSGALFFREIERVESGLAGFNSTI